MNIRAIDFFSYEVADLEKSVAFYRDTLGLTMTMHHENMWAEFEVASVALALYSPTPHEQRPPQVGGGMVWLAVDDVEATLAELKEKGLEAIMPFYETPVCHMAIILDPDGNKVGLHHRKDGTAG